MRIFGFELSIKGAESIETVLRRFEAAMESVAGITVTPENCTESPTVQAIVNAVSKHIAALPLHVYERDGEGRKPAPDHSVARLLRRPNDWQTAPEFWLDATSALLRYGYFGAIKARGVTGPIQRLYPVHGRDLILEQNDNTLEVVARVSRGAAQRVYPFSQILYVRERSCDYLNGTSPVMEAREAIGLEIAAQRFGGSFFGNGAMPGLVFSYAEGFKGHMNDDQRRQFLEQFHEAYGKRGRFRALLLPNGIRTLDPIKVENDKAQFLETRKLQRNIIAGAFGIPPHLVGDLERGTFANVEQQSRDFVQKVVLPYCRLFEAAMERDLLTQADRNAGITIRFNLDGTLRGSFKEQQEGLKIQREMGVINADEWREYVGLNPIGTANGGNVYWQQGPSGQNANSASQGQDDDDDQLPD